MAEIKGALIMCDRCGISAFTKLGDYDSIETPHDWHKVRFGTRLQDYNLCPSCNEEFELAKRSFFSEVARTQCGIIVRRNNNDRS